MTTSTLIGPCTGEPRVSKRVREAVDAVIERRKAVFLALAEHDKAEGERDV